MKLIYNIMLAVAFFIPVATLSQDGKPHGELSDWIKAVENEGIAPLYQVLKESSESAKYVTEKIIAHISMSDDNETKCKGFFALGEISDLSAMHYLLANLNFQKSKAGNLQAEMTLISNYPAQQALIKMGLRAMPWIREALSKENDVTKYPAYLTVIYEIYSAGNADYESSLLIYKIIMDDFFSTLSGSEKKGQLRNEFIRFVRIKEKTVEKINAAK
ncbi:MAG: hypothetical protein HPZ91_14060 [Lentisphaeria bacterium]|nr:hypothetical protein [Lentisphaeria bacterium]